MADLLKAVFIISGLLLAGSSISMIVEEIRRFSQVRAWPKEVGLILDSRVTIDSTGDGDIYGVHVEYRYTIDKWPHRGSMDIQDGSISSRQQAEELCRSYSSGLALPIAYNPQRAEQSEIADRLQEKLKVGVILQGILLLAFSILWSVGIPR